MSHIALATGNKQVQARALYWNVYAGCATGDDALQLIDRAIELSDSVRYPYDHARITLSKALLLSSCARYYEAFVLYNTAADLFTQVGDIRSAAIAYYNIGYILVLLEEYDYASSYIMRSDSLFLSMELLPFHDECRLLLANAYSRSGRKDDAYKILKPVVDSLLFCDASFVKMAAFSAYLPLLDNPDSLYKYSHLAYNLAGQMQMPHFLAVTMLNKGRAFLQAGSLDSAYIYACRTRDVLQPSTSPSLYEGLGSLLASVYEKQCRWDSAYYYLKMSYAYQDSLRGKEIVNRINRLKIAKEMEQQQLRTDMERQKNRQLLTSSLTIGILLVLMLAASAGVIYALRRKLRREHALQMEKDKAYIAQLREEKELVESKNRELSSHMALLMKKNETFSAVLKDVERIDKGDENAKAVIRDMQEKIQSELRYDDSWDSFKMHFEKVHPAFFATLTRLHPRLTNNELRLCAYIRIGLTNKQIAQTLMVQPKAVIQARYRLKIRMNLASSMTIDDYLKSLPETE